MGLPQVFPLGVGNLARPCFNVALIAAFDHDAQERFGARIAHQQTAVAGKSAFDVAHDLGNRRHGLGVAFSRTGTFTSTCGYFVSSPARSATRPLVRHGSQHRQCRDDPSPVDR